MNYLNFSIQLNKEKYDGFNKLSHENKSLKNHIEEIITVGSALIDFYHLNSLSKKVLSYLAFCHDLGKLQKEWRIENLKKNPSHSEESIRIIINQLRSAYRFKEKKEYEILLLYFIKQHHSSLKKRVFELDNYVFDLNNNLKSLSFNEKIFLVDTFGIFKIADSISADSRNFKDVERKINQIVKKIVVSPNIIKSKLDLTDERRWRDQLKIVNLGDVSLLQAPTGWGKTISSFLFSVNKNYKRIFYILPTITAIRDFKKKLERVVGKENIETYFYFYEVEKIAKKEEVDLEALFFAEHFLKPIIITTIDQLLLTFLQLGKYHLKRFNFQNAIFIVDEIHLFSPLMLKLFLHFFNQFKKIYQLKLLVMSATLTDALVNILRRELQISQKNYLNFNNNLSKKLRIKFKYYKKNIIEFLPKIVHEFQKKKKVLVIVNTVDKAIMLGKELFKKHNIKEIIVFHSRFIYKDRLKKEAEILGKYKKKPHILVCTQIAEVSLDISYDFLFTEVAPFPSLVQRFGRVNRYGERKINKINCLIFYPQEINQQKRYPYQKDELETTISILNLLENKKIKNEQEIYDQINEIENEKSLKETIEKAGDENGFSLNSWEEVLNYFYAFSLNEERLKQILDYREGLTTLVLLDPQIIENKNLSEEMEKFLTCQQNQKKDFKQRRLLVAKAKELSIPIPYYLAKQSKEEGGFPILKLSDFSYNYQYGLYRIEVNDQMI